MDIIGVLIARRCRKECLSFLVILHPVDIDLIMIKQRDFFKLDIPISVLLHI